MGFSWFRKRSVSSDVISQDDLLRYSEPSLFIFGNIYFSFGYFKDPYSYTQISGSIHDDIGFANNWLQPLSNVPERTHDFSSALYCIDRFIRFERGDCGNALARIEVKEAHVRDDYVRSDIDYTGFEVCVTLREEAFRLFQDHLTSIEPESETFRHSRRLAVRIPVRPFIFPLPRGNVDPWNTQQNVVGKLRPIKRFSVDNITVTMMSREPLTSPPSGGTLYDRYQPWLRTTISIHYR
jgi:hypothetical protein